MGYDTTQTRANQYQLAVFVHCKMPYRAIILLGSKDAVYYKETNLPKTFPCTPNTENNHQHYNESDSNNG